MGEQEQPMVSHGRGGKKEKRKKKESIVNAQLN